MNLRTTAGLDEFLADHGFRSLLFVPREPSPKVGGDHFCNRCRRVQRHLVSLAAARRDHTGLATDAHPSVLELLCGNCSALSHVLVYDVREAGRLTRRIRTTADCTGGIGTPSTPDHVRRWLDEARRAELGGALASSAATYRVVLDTVLLSEGLVGKMLGHKIADLENKMSAGTAPGWARHVDLELIKALKGIGNKTLHAGDVAKDPTTIVTPEVLRAMESVIDAFLDRVYGVSARRQAEKAELDAAYALLDS